MNEIVIGRLQDLGTQGRILIGKHYVQMGQTTALSNPVFLDVATSHVVLVVGKRGGGKSYTMGVLAEGLTELPKDVAQNLSTVILDTMGVFWTMKFPNLMERQMLADWNLKAKGMNVQIYTPIGYYASYKQQGIPTDFPFSIKPGEISGQDWCASFSLSPISEVGVLIERVIAALKEKGDFSMEDVIATLRNDTDSEKVAREAAINLFTIAQSWGVFHDKGTPLADLVQPGQATILDVSCYATLPDGWRIKALVVALVCQKLFAERMDQRKGEEFDLIHKTSEFSAKPQGKRMPLVWVMLDEAHEFLPSEGTTLASFPLTTILREGRQPGISLVLATQQPGKISQDAMTQADVVIAHRVTAKVDTDALGTLMQSYMREGLTSMMDNLPRDKGSAIVFDDCNEKMYPLMIRPRLTWHGGGAPSAVDIKRKLFDLS
ncbi:MAG: DUF87 domain-containing protein [Nanoarchaeota archaeon]